jgi:hypothetical protein
MAKIGVYIAHHKWLDYDFGEGRLYKVGYSTNLDRRLCDSSYTTCFVGAWKYKYVFLVKTQTDAELLETRLLSRAKRVDFKELVNNTLEELIDIINTAACELNIMRHIIEIDPEPIPAPILAPIVTLDQIALIDETIQTLKAKGRAELICDVENKNNIIATLVNKYDTWCVYLTESHKHLLSAAAFAEQNCDRSIIKIDKTNGLDFLAAVKQSPQGIVFCTYSLAHLIYTTEFGLCIFDEGHKRRAVYELTKRPHFRNHLYINNTN